MVCWILTCLMVRRQEGFLLILKCIVLCDTNFIHPLLENTKNEMQRNAYMGCWFNQGSFQSIVFYADLFVSNVYSCEQYVVATLKT